MPESKCRRPKGAGIYIYIRQILSAHIITTTYHLGQYNKNCPNLKTTAQLLFIVWFIGFDCEFSYDFCVMILLRILSKIITETSYSKLTIKLHN